MVVLLVSWLSSYKKDFGYWSSENLNEVVCISHSANILGKGMHPTILPPAIGKIVGQTGFFHLHLTTGLGEGKL